MYGAPGGTRTPRTLILSQVRIPIPSQGHVVGAWERDRTADTLLFRQVLYQLSYPSIYFGLGISTIPARPIPAQATDH